MTDNNRGLAVLARISEQDFPSPAYRRHLLQGLQVEHGWADNSLWDVDGPPMPVDDTSERVFQKRASKA